MARPAPNIILSQEQENGELWEITAHDTNYVILYKEKLCGVRVSGMFRPAFKYKKLSYPTLGSARRQVRLLNEKFNTVDFSYARLE